MCFTLANHKVGDQNSDLGGWVSCQSHLQCRETPKKDYLLILPFENLFFSFFQEKKERKILFILRLVFAAELFIILLFN